MTDAEGSVPTAAGGTPVTYPVSDRIPGRRVRALLAFECVALAEYWLVPIFVPVGNLAGTWSAIGQGLFIALASTLALGVLLPLRALLSRAIRTRRARALYASLWISSLLGSLLATQTMRIVDPASSSGASIATTSVFTAFGDWPAVVFDASPLPLAGSLDVASLLGLVLLSGLWSSAFALASSGGWGARPDFLASADRWRSPLTAIAFWAPLGFVSGCSFCAPTLVAALSFLAPGTAQTAYDSIPIVPWTGLSGLLLLAALILGLSLVSRTTGNPRLAGARHAARPPT
jgi:hypothetical protein